MIILKVILSKFVPNKLHVTMKYILILLFGAFLLGSCSATEDCPNYSTKNNQTENLNS
jgi:PBP1b-binding outer membrane lipoprotein LpoB